MDRWRNRGNGSWRRLALLPLAFLFLAPTSGTGNDAVSATISANCKITTSTFDFGGYDPMVTNATVSNPLDTSAQTVSVQCTRGATGVTIGLSTGSNPTHASGTSRAMSDGAGDYISYELYTTNAHATVWNTTNTQSYTPTSFAATGFTVYGEIPGGQDMPVGTYTDSVTATVNF